MAVVVGRSTRSLGGMERAMNKSTEYVFVVLVWTFTVLTLGGWIGWYLAHTITVALGACAIGLGGLGVIVVWGRPGRGGAPTNTQLQDNPPSIGANRNDHAT